MNDINSVLAGFGGQGLLFLGKIIAQAGLADNKHVSWLPSYGPEMRGGTCNCSVCVSEDEICSPLVTSPNVLVVMNNPSYDKFIGKVAPGGIVLVDSTLIDRKCTRDDITVYYVPATQLAEDNNMKGLANIILLGKMLAATQFTTIEIIETALRGIVPPKMQQLVPLNLEAVKIGMNS
jgi:2-oxoglutarate ferredoxin oxidoreductase subunit gamma